MSRPTILRAAPGMRPLARTRRALPRALFIAMLLALPMAAARSAMAGACGDSIDGKRVACACGDNVVTDTVLWATDPVVTEPCSGDGLTVLASSESDGVTLNLGGQSITGRGYGSGIRVARGGRLGAIIVGGDAEDARAEIAHFGTGIRASGTSVLREVRSIDIHDNAADGLFLHTSGVKLDDVRSEGNGRDGIAVSGHGNEVSGVAASHNARDGLKVRGSAATVAAETTDNDRNGAVIGGRGNHVEKIRTDGNGNAGIVATGTGHEVREVHASGNAGGSLAGRPGAVK